MDYVTAENPAYASEDKSSISLTLITNDYGNLPYIVEAYDVDTFAIEIYLRAIHGDFGEIAPFTQ